jgi:hypothetical protein
MKPPIPAQHRRLPAAALLCALLLTACGTGMQSAPTAPVRRPAATKPAPSVPPPASGAPAHPPAPPATPAPGSVPPVASGNPPRPELPANTPSGEWQQLAPYQKSPFQVFSLTETQAGFVAAPGAVGVLVQTMPNPGPIRLRLALRPDSPVRLASGSYSVLLQLAFEYTERRTCKVASCNGEIEESNRKKAKTVRLLLTPRNGYAAEATLPLALLKSGPPDRGYDVSHTGIVLKVRRMTVAPAR